MKRLNIELRLWADCVEKLLRSAPVGAELEFCFAGGRICLPNGALSSLSKTGVLKIQAVLSQPEFFNAIGWLASSGGAHKVQKRRYIDAEPPHVVFDPKV